MITILQRLAELARMILQLNNNRYIIFSSKANFSRKSFLETFSYDKYAHYGFHLLTFIVLTLIRDPQFSSSNRFSSSLEYWTISFKFMNHYYTFYYFSVISKQQNLKIYKLMNFHNMTENYLKRLDITSAIT